MKSYLDNPVFLCGHRKSGTTMLINLFDSIKGSITYPDDSGFFYKYFPRYESNEYTNQEKIDRLCSVIIDEKLTEVINDVNCSAFDKEMLLKKQNIFSTRMRDFNKNDFNYKDIMLHFIESFRQSFYDNHEAKVWIEKTTSTEVYAAELSNDFPNAKFIHIIRDPRDNWGSLLSGWDQKYTNFNDSKERLLQSLIERGRLGMEFAKSNLSTIGDKRYKIVRFEDLTHDPEYWMNNIAEFVGLDFSEKLLAPTVFGYPWHGNNFDGVELLRPSPVNVSKWKDRISEKDAKIIEFYFNDSMEYFNYDKYYTSKDSQLAAAEHYKWFNFSTKFSDK